MTGPQTWHVPRRPSWNCAACRQSWPCAPAKADLVDQFGDDTRDLMIYLAGQLNVAIDDATAHRSAVPPDLYGRFLS